VYLRALLISQDRDELYIAKADFEGNRYKDFMQDKDRKSLRENEFLKIYQYGRWLIDDREDVEGFARLVLAVALRASDEDMAQLM
jgi:hypothetical protein